MIGSKSTRERFVTGINQNSPLQKMMEDGLRLPLQLAYKEDQGFNSQSNNLSLQRS